VDNPANPKAACSLHLCETVWFPPELHNP